MTLLQRSLSNAPLVVERDLRGNRVLNASLLGVDCLHSAVPAEPLLAIAKNKVLPHVYVDMKFYGSFDTPPPHSLQEGV